MKTHILCLIKFFFSENRTVYEIMSKNLVETEGPQMTSQYGAYELRAGLQGSMDVCACTRPRARVPTCTHARTRKHAHADQYVILIASPQQQWFRERASMLRYTYIGCVVLLSANLRQTHVARSVV